MTEGASRRNIYAPRLMTVAAVTDEAPGIRTLRLEFQDAAEGEGFTFRAGQFAMYSVFGAGECPLCIASPPTRTGCVECTFRTAGRVTRELADVEPGDTIGFRGPYGNCFPTDEWEGRHLVFVAGGIGLPPVRCVIGEALDRRNCYGRITIIYGARTPADLVYKGELREWQQRHDVRLITTVDPGGETPDWEGEVGFVPSVLEKARPSSDNAVAVVCGPPVMIRFAIESLHHLGFGLDSIYTTLENRMKCGVGKCGRCNVGSLYVCKDGPVFTAQQVMQMPE